MKPADRLANIELSLIRQINALATPLSTNLGIGEPNLEPDEVLRGLAREAANGPWAYSPNPPARTRPAMLATTPVIPTLPARTLPLTLARGRAT